MVVLLKRAKRDALAMLFWIVGCAINGGAAVWREMGDEHCYHFRRVSFSDQASRARAVVGAEAVVAEGSIVQEPSACLRNTSRNAAAEGDKLEPRRWAAQSVR